MATNDDIVNRVRLELGDTATTFDITMSGNGVATRYETGTYPVDGTLLIVTVDGVADTNITVEERTGVVTFAAPPGLGSNVRFQGTKYRYFGPTDLQTFIDSSVAEQTNNRTDSFNRQMNLANLPIIEEYPLALLATVKALWALATDSSFDIDISAPDGVSIPRSERYRQLMEMITARQAQYDEYAALLNIGIQRIEVMQLRRVSKMTGRLVPIFIEHEIDDNSKPQRVWLPTNTYGSSPMPSNQVEQDFATTQGDFFSYVLDFGYDVTNFSYLAQVRLYAASETLLQTFTVTPVTGQPTQVTLSLTSDQTKLLPLEGVWDIVITNNADPTDIRTPFGGRIFCQQDVSRLDWG